MPRVRCPECDTKVNVPDDHRQSYIRCTSCGKRIALAEDNDGEARQASRVFRKKKSRQQSEYQAYLPLLLIFPMLSCLCVAPFYRIGGGIGMLVGLAVMLTALGKIYYVIKRKGLASWDDVPWYLRGGGAMMYYQFKYAFQMPKEIGIWLLVEIVGFVVTFAGGIIGERQTKLANQRAAQEMVPEQKVNWPGNKEIDNGGNPALALTGDAALDGILAELESKNELAVRRAAQTLAEKAPNQHQAVVARQLAAQVQRTDVFTQKAVVRALGRWATINEVPALISVIESKRAFAVDDALDALGKLGDERAVAPIVRRIRDEGPSAMQVTSCAS